MTKRVGNVVVIESTDPAECTACHKTAELRPYGKDGAWVCFECAMKDEPEAVAQFNKLFDGKRDI